VSGLHPHEGASPNVSSENAMIAPRSLFRCGFVIESIPQLDDEIGARARSARAGNTLYFANITGIFNKYSALVALLSGRMKYSG
jgi:hypothetical protein